MIACLIPAHNEQDTIAATLDSVLDQTRWVSKVIVIADNCMDDTVQVVDDYVSREYPRPRNRRQRVHRLETVNNADRKAGALNQGWFYVCDYDFILTMDADTILEPDFVEKAVRELEAKPYLGGVCARYWAKKRTEIWPLGLMNAFQRLEYARFDDSRELRDWRVSVLSGAAVVYRGEALRQVCEWRETGVVSEANRCTCHVRGKHGEKPRKRVVPHKAVHLPGDRPFYLPPVETDDIKCPVHGIAGRKIMRKLGLS